MCSGQNEKSYENCKKKKLPIDWGGIVGKGGGGGETGKNQATIVIIISQHLKLRRKPSNL